MAPQYIKINGSELCTKIFAYTVDKAKEATFDMMHYPSILFLPLPMAILAISHHIHGPQKTLQIIQPWVKWILKHQKPKKCGFEPDDLTFELKCLQKLTPTPYIACFEQACAFQFWLALHGQCSRVCLGKRCDHGQLRMHAWLETDPEPFFYDPRFQEIPMHIP